jgi:hypothetical protein
VDAPAQDFMVIAAQFCRRVIGVSVIFFHENYPLQDRLLPRQCIENQLASLPMNLSRSANLKQFWFPHR